MSCFQLLTSNYAESQSLM